MFIPLLTFAFVSSVTPGPNNLMLMASGANFGLRRTVPHMLGVSLGHGFLVLCAGYGLAALFAAFPWLERMLLIVAVGYMLWLAWKIATAAPVKPGEGRGKPLTFLQAAAFQWVNPKAVAMAINANAIYGIGLEPPAVAAAFITMNLPSITLWAVMGTQIARYLHKPSHMRAFNYVMAALLVSTLAMIV